MNIQDRKKSFTAEELRIRYNLDGLDKDRKAIQLIRETLNKVEVEFQRFIDLIDSSFAEYPSQVEITTWFFDGIPSATQPEIETPSDHVGDFYYDRQTGKAYQYVYENSEYTWKERTEPIVVETLAIENSKSDTGDNKRLVFKDTPTTPYSIGDVWINGNTYYRCRAARDEGAYNIVDWVLYTDYTEDIVLLDTRAVLNQLEKNVTQNYVTTTQLETNTQGIYANVAETYFTKADADEENKQIKINKADISTLNISSNKISSRVESLENGYFKYYYTTDATYLDTQGKEYYSYDSEHDVYVLLVAGTDYTVGDTIPANRVYEREWVFGTSDLTQTLSTIQSTFVEQTSSEITTWFNSPLDPNDPNSKSLSNIVSGLSSDNTNNIDQLNIYRSYIRQSTYTGYLLTTDISVVSGKTYYTRSGNTYTQVTNPTNANIKNYYEYVTAVPYLELGKEDNQTTLRIMPQRIQFLTNGEETAYISNNSLYISESTILIRQQIGHWVTVEDSNHNLNTYWQD